MKQQKLKIFKNNVEAIECFAEHYDWDYKGCDPNTGRLSYQNEDCKIDVYPTKNTVMIQFPSVSPLWLKNKTIIEVEEIFANPKHFSK